MQFQGKLLDTIEEDFWLELAQIQAESIAWIPLDEGAYLHIGSDEPVIHVVGIAKAEMAGAYSSDRDHSI